MARGALGLVAVFAVALLFGWLKTLYYFETFGVQLGLVDPSPGALLLESWFVVQNVALFALVAWVALKSREVWVIVIGLIYGTLPILSHYAFEFEDSAVARELIDYRHTALKVVPFLVITILWIAQRRHRPTLKDPAWPYGRPALLLFLGVVLFWGISASKHFGAYDANRALRRPERHLSRISLPVADLDRAGHAAVDPESLYLIAATDHDLILWVRPAQTGAATVRTIVIRRDEVASYEITRPAQVQPGSQFL